MQAHAAAVLERLHLVAGMAEVGQGNQRRAALQPIRPLDAGLRQPPLAVEGGASGSGARVQDEGVDVVRGSSVEQPSLEIQRLRGVPHREIRPGHPSASANLAGRALASGLHAGAVELQHPAQMETLRHLEVRSQSRQEMLVLPAVVDRARERRRAPDGLGLEPAADRTRAAVVDAQREIRPRAGVPEHGDQARLVLQQRLRPRDGVHRDFPQDLVRAVVVVDECPERLREQVAGRVVQDDLEVFAALRFLVVQYENRERLVRSPADVAERRRYKGGEHVVLPLRCGSTSHGQPDRRGRRVDIQLRLKCDPQVVPRAVAFRDVRFIHAPGIFDPPAYLVPYHVRPASIVVPERQGGRIPGSVHRPVKGVRIARKFEDDRFIQFLQLVVIDMDSDRLRGLACGDDDMARAVGSAESGKTFRPDYRLGRQ